MKVERGQAAFITGAGGGIGRALAVALASRGVQITVLDMMTTKGEETVRLVEEAHAKISYRPNSPSAIFIDCDVTKTDDLAAAFARHQNVFGRLDICINNAGVGDGEPFYGAGVDSWRKVIEVNLIALIDGTSKAIQEMKERGGLILNLGSAASFIPVPFGPIYSASKGGVAMFTRSLAHLGMGIRVNSLCPEYVETPLLEDVPVFLRDYFRDQMGFVKMERILEATFSLLDDESKKGECIWVPVNRPTQTWPDDETNSKYQAFKKNGSAFTGVFN
ncbi:hypothetical protein M758_11G081700 [Ceratodon purpureus]|nr:hypothetical protein M758_11G081700 [Ceratodon purpureus]